MFQFYVNSKNESLEKEYQSTKGFFVMVSLNMVIIIRILFKFKLKNLLCCLLLNSEEILFKHIL